MNDQKREETSILKYLLPNFIKWHQILRLNLESNINVDALKDILLRAGYLNPDSDISFLAMMLTPLVVDELEGPICYFLKTEDTSYTLRAAALLSGCLGFKQTIPLLYQVIKENRCDLYDFLQAVKSLFILEADPQEIYNTIVSSEEHANEDQSIRLTVLAALQIEDKNLIQQTISQVKKMEDEDYRTYTTLMFQNDWHELGIDIFECGNFIQTPPDYCSDKVVKWLKAFGGRKEVLEKIFNPVENESFCFDLVCRAISEPGEWGFLKSHVEENYDSWNKRHLEYYLKIALMLLLLQWGRDYKKVQKEDDWCQRTAVYLYLAGKGKDAELESFEEEDSDAETAIQFSLLISSGRTGSLQKALIMSLYREMSGYRIDRICSSLVEGLGLGEQYPELSLDYALCNKERIEDIKPWIEKTPNWFLHRLLKWEPPSWSELLNPHDRQALNIFFILISIPSVDIAPCIEENFISQSDYDRSEVIAVAASLNNISFNTMVAVIKEIAHYSSIESSPLKREEMEEAYRMLFDYSLDGKYRALLLAWISPLLNENINKAYSLLRFIRDETFQDHVLSHILPNPSISSRVGRCNCLKITDKEKILLLIDKYGMRNIFIPWLLSMSKSRSLEEQESLNLLLEALDTSVDDVQGKSILKEITSYVSADELYLLIKNRFIQNTQDSTVLSHIEENPEPVYLELVFSKLYSDSFYIRQAAFNSILSIKNRELENEEYFIFFNREENDDDSFQQFYEVFGELMTAPDFYKSVIEQKFIVKICRTGSELEAHKNQIDKDEWHNLLLYLIVDFVDEKGHKLVCRVSDEKSGELLNWFLEQGDHHFYTVQKAWS